MTNFKSLAFFLLALSPGMLFAQETLTLTVGESHVLSVASSKKVILSNQTIGEVKILSDKEVLINAKTPGKANLEVMDANGEWKTIILTVQESGLKRSMIDLDVEVLETDLNSSLQAGINWATVNGESIQQNSAAVSLPSTAELVNPDVFNFGTVYRQPLEASIQLLMSEGKAKILSRPHLRTVSGEEASFLAGGKIPYATQSTIGVSTIDWAEYGVQLRIQPVLQPGGDISAHIRAEDSELDLVDGVQLSAGGSVVPAIKTRWAETNVYMRNGSTLVIAGLMQEETTKNSSGIPVLMDIPILGELFKTTQSTKTQSELVILVTPSEVGANP
jgi:Flp pilus assembly secretin CpaC